MVANCGMILETQVTSVPVQLAAAHSMLCVARRLPAECFTFRPIKMQVVLTRELEHDCAERGH